ncbi:MAG: Holliday junction resolvase RuvX [Moorellaceae bacterium]
MRIMGLDIGDRTIGVALSDPLGWTAQSLTTIRRSHTEEDLAALSKLVQEYEVGRIVVGLPLSLNGTWGPQAQKVKEFVHKLGKILAVPVVLWDERLTTAAAERILLEADLSRRRRKGIVDRLAAALILQSYLDCHRSDGV